MQGKHLSVMTGTVGNVCLSGADEPPRTILIMSYLDQLPEAAKHLLRTGLVSEYATISATGVPIDTPLYYFPKPDLSTIDLATGLAYPVKADRARRNPKVGLLIEGTPAQPIISIAGYAAVRDGDLQANLERYVSETIVTPIISPEVNDWNVVRAAIHYLARIIIEVTPAHVRWWPNRAAMDSAPHEWRAPPDTIFPTSDRFPPGKASAPSEWRQRSWQELATEALESNLAAYLTVIDQDGYPLPFRAKEVTACDGGFRIVMPESLPWSAGKATLSFIGKEIFIGAVTFSGGVHIMQVERALPVLPLVDDGKVLQPEDSVRESLMERLKHELARRGQEMPVVPEIPPRPTALALLRAAGAANWQTLKD
jgi:hypothetical protein